MPLSGTDEWILRRSRTAAEAYGRFAAEADVLSDDAVMTVIGSGTSLEGDRWVLGTDGDDDDPATFLEVETPTDITRRVATRGLR